MYAGAAQERLVVNILYDKKLKFFKLVCGKRKELKRKVSLDMLRNHESIKLIVNEWCMKLQAYLDKSESFFHLYHILGLERKLEESSVIKDSKGKLTLQNWRIC